jgi:hypothetical protein
MRTRLKSMGQILAFAASLSATQIEFMAPAYALPAGYFHLRGTVHDDFGGGALRSIDVQGRGGQISHFLNLNSTGYAKDSQLWKERFPRNGTIDVIRLENKLTGQCIGEPGRRPEDLAILSPCSDENTLWQKIAMSGDRAVFRRDTNGSAVCLGKDAGSPSLLLALDCSNGYTDKMIWQAYVSG